eukprot:315778_1
MKKKSDKWNLMKQYLSNPHFKLLIQTIWSRNIIYYQQSISQILSSTTLSVLFSGFTHIFGLNIANTNSANTHQTLCFINGMNAKHKILCNLIMPAMIVLFVSVFHLITVCVCRKSSNRSSIVLCKKREINFAKAYVSVLLLIMG